MSTVEQLALLEEPKPEIDWIWAKLRYADGGCRWMHLPYPAPPVLMGNLWDKGLERVATEPDDPPDIAMRKYEYAGTVHSIQMDGSFAKAFIQYDEVI